MFVGGHESDDSFAKPEVSEEEEVKPVKKHKKKKSRSKTRESPMEHVAAMEHQKPYVHDGVRPNDETAELEEGITNLNNS